MVRQFPVRPCFVVDGVTYSTFAIVDDRSGSPIFLSCALPLTDTNDYDGGHACSVKHGGLEKR